MGVSDVSKSLLEILKSDRRPVITVFGDFCLDKYLYINAALEERSLETGLTAYQVTNKKVYAGAGGTITNNLCTLKAKVYCVGITGDDGEGYELLKCLEGVGANTSLMVRSKERSTCAYIKPMHCDKGLEIEMNRQDYKNFTKTPSALETQLIENLYKAARVSNAVIVCDQYLEEDCAAVTTAIRNAISDLSIKYPNLIVYADSRANIDKFRNTIIKCNHKELSKLFHRKEKDITEEVALVLSKELYAACKMPVYVTLGDRGITVYDGTNHIIPAFTVKGKIDVVGAGDACSAGIVFALAKGADYEQAALVGNAASSLVIQQIGVTGTAAIDDVLAVLKEAVE
jgi:rfaE bifunctional protein kinase chain/domain